VTYLPDPGHPEYQAFKKLRIIEQARNCTEQESLLETCLAKAGEPVIVASYMIVKDRNTGAYDSYCLWSEGRPVLLPQADQVGFVTAGNKVAGSAPWDRVREIAGDMMKPMGTYPERFKVRDFPSPKQLAAMGVHDGP
jgi:hypothetical protein